MLRVFRWKSPKHKSDIVIKRGLFIFRALVGILQYTVALQLSKSQAKVKEYRSYMTEYY